MTWAFCRAPMRRDYLEAEVMYPELGKRAVGMIEELYRTERKATRIEPGVPADELEQLERSLG